jgi:cell division GTPase FtsZ
METKGNMHPSSDTRHRIATPNSHPRQIKLVGLGSGGAQVTTAIGVMNLHRVQAIPVPDGGPVAAAELLKSLCGADMIFVVACAGDEVQLAVPVKQFGREHGVQVTSILIQSRQAMAMAPARLAQLRAASDMLVIASDESYVVDMLVELGA